MSVEEELSNFGEKMMVIWSMKTETIVGERKSEIQRGENKRMNKEEEKKKTEDRV